MSRRLHPTFEDMLSSMIAALEARGAAISKWCYDDWKKANFPIYEDEGVPAKICRACDEEIERRENILKEKIKELNGEIWALQTSLDGAKDASEADQEDIRHLRAKVKELGG